jgi:hypothetical protein
MRRRDPLTLEQERDLEAIDRALAGEPVERDLRELEELVRDVRATAPAMSPAFAARLEHELSEGFPTPRERPPHGRGRGPVRLWVLLPAAGSLAAVLVALVVVFGGGGDHATNSADPATVGAVKSEETTSDSGDAPAADATRSAPGSGSVRDQATPAPAASAPAPSAARAKTVAPSVGGLAAARTVQRSASLSLETTDEAFDATTDAVNTTVARFGGIVASSQIGAGDPGGGEATFDLRIPTDRLDRALAALSKLGHVTERSQSLDDITGSLHSARERLIDARAERRGLLRALGRATTQQQIDSLKAQLRTISGRIAGLKGQVASLRRRADLATVSLTVRGGGESGATGGGDRWTPGDAAGDAVRVLEVLAGVVLIGLAVAVPGGLIAVAVALAVRQGRRRRREAALDPA